MTPPSPWTGSTSTAQVRGVTAARAASTSPYFTMRKPGENGPKRLDASGSVENPTMVVVRPWKLPSATTISASG